MTQPQAYDPATKETTEQLSDISMDQKKVIRDQYLILLNVLQEGTFSGHLAAQIAGSIHLVEGTINQIDAEIAGENSQDSKPMADA